MRLRTSMVTAVAVATVALPAAPVAARQPGDGEPDAGAVTSAEGRDYAPGAPGIGDPYFPLDGNGGYDVALYDLDIAYDPDTDQLDGEAVIWATATEDLSALNLDLENLTVTSVQVNGRPAGFSHDGAELTVTPRHGLRNRVPFVVKVVYGGTPQAHQDPNLGNAGWFNTDDGSLVAGEPDVAATWFPVNDHPRDKAAYRISIEVPEGLQAISNGVLISERTRRGRTTWSWLQREPMASYLATATIGRFEVDAYRADGIRYWDAVDPDLYVPGAEPVTGDRYARSQTADGAYRRLTHTLAVPDEGASLTFQVDRNSDVAAHHFLVEAHTVGADDWTTLPDGNGHTTTDTGGSCPGLLELHPFLEHYQTAGEAPDDGAPAEPCEPRGTTGSWNAASGSSDGYETWSIDLSGYAGTEVEVSLTYVSGVSLRKGQVFVDDVDVSTGEGTTSFEDDADPLDGWTVPGPPEGSPGNDTDWVAGTAEDVPTLGDTIDAVFARQPEIVEFLSERFGPYPFSAAGGLVDDLPVSFALETQTRPIYAKFLFADQALGDSVVVHELAHQWFGDSVAVAAWQHIWLNEGFATYAQWLWDEEEGIQTTQETFDLEYGAAAPDPEYWALPIGDPGPEALFDTQVYDRGAMTLHELRATVGDDAFFTTLQRWAAENDGGNGTTDEFIALAEAVSGQELDDLFQAWLFGTEVPPSVSYVAPTTPVADAAGVARRELVATGPAVHGLEDGAGRPEDGPRR